MKCEECGDPIEQAARGRRRRTCGGACRKAKSRGKRKTETVAEPIRRFVPITRRGAALAEMAVLDLDDRRHPAPPTVGSVMRCTGYSFVLLSELGPGNTILVGQEEAKRVAKERLAPIPLAARGRR
jgi:hypothetical protein